MLLCEEILYRMARFWVFACIFITIRDIFLFVAVLVRGVYLIPIAIVCIAPFPIFIGGLIIFILVSAVLVGIRILAACRTLVTRFSAGLIVRRVAAGTLVRLFLLL